MENEIWKPTNFSLEYSLGPPKDDGKGKAAVVQQRSTKKSAGTAKGVDSQNPRRDRPPSGSAKNGMVLLSISLLFFFCMINLFGVYYGDSLNWNIVVAASFWHNIFLLRCCCRRNDEELPWVFLVFLNRIGLNHNYLLEYQLFLHLLCLAPPNASLQFVLKRTDEFFWLNIYPWVFITILLCFFFIIAWFTQGAFITSKTDGKNGKNICFTYRCKLQYFDSNKSAIFFSYVNISVPCVNCGSLSEKLLNLMELGSYTVFLLNWCSSGPGSADFEALSLDLYDISLRIMLYLELFLLIFNLPTGAPSSMEGRFEMPRTVFFSKS